jgi:hypothetical protein
MKNRRDCYAAQNTYSIINLRITIVLIRFSHVLSVRRISILLVFTRCLIEKFALFDIVSYGVLVFYSV